MRTIAILFSNFGPYHIARVAAAAKAAEETLGIQVIGIELTKRSSVYDWEADTSQLPFTLHTIATQEGRGGIIHNDTIRALMTKLEALKPDAIAIAGYANAAMLAALRWARGAKCKTILMSETSEEDFRRGWFKEWLKRRIVSKFDSALVGGAPQKRYLQKLGMSSSRIFTGYDVVNNDVFSPSKIRDLPRPIPAQYFLAINRFVPKKNLGLLISAYSSYHQQVPEPWDLVLCGDGELRTEVETQISCAGISDHVHLTGFLQQDEMLPYFAHAGCFVHASTREQWGLVVNEAMAAGLPVLLSNRCGCFEDLLREGVNGYGFDPHDADALASLMAKMSAGDTDLEAMSKAAAEHISQFSPKRFAEGLLQASGLGNLP